jgi:hypothetical protein
MFLTSRIAVANINVTAKAFQRIVVENISFTADRLGFSSRRLQRYRSFGPAAERNVYCTSLLQMKRTQVLLREDLVL